MTIRVAFVIQHHPSRAHLLPGLLERVPGALVVEDPGGGLASAWRTQRLCLTADVDATHIVVIQDDAHPCEHFHEAAVAAITAKPDAAIAFFVGGQPVPTALEITKALKRREPWAPVVLSDWWPTVCSSYPVVLAREIAGWVDARPKTPRGDDAQLGDFMRAHRHHNPWLATVPSLVQHPDIEPSLIGRRHMAGRNLGRVARHFIGDQDARLIKW